jgi:hypothetical protein
MFADSGIQTRINAFIDLAIASLLFIFSKEHCP